MIYGLGTVWRCDCCGEYHTLLIIDDYPRVIAVSYTHLKQLRRFAAVFGDEETRVLAHEIVGRYPNRTALREELAFAL